MKFAVGVADRGQLVGVTTAGRPVARHLDDGQTVEVTRTCTLGAHNANSMLYGAAWRTARGMGYSKLITYTQDGGTVMETAGVLRRGGAGWRSPGPVLPRQAGTRR